MAKDIPRLYAARLKAEQLEHIYVAGVFLGDGDFRLFNVKVSKGPKNVMLPVMAVDEAGLEMLKRYAQEEADETGQTVSIISFKDHEVYDNFRPVNTTGG